MLADMTQKLRGTAILLREAVRQCICEILNHHAISDKQPIALIGSRRSGSTLLMQVLSQYRGIKGVDQPFSHFMRTGGMRHTLPLSPNGIFLGMDERTENELTEYVGSIISGATHVGEPWRFWEREFKIFSDRILFKTTDAHFLAVFLKDTFNAKIINYVRHPIPQALSCSRNSWGDKLQFFDQSREFNEKYLNQYERELFDNIYKSSNDLLKHVLCWCCENKNIYSGTRTTDLLVHYEDLVSNTEDSLAEICTYLDIELMPEMLKTTVRSSRSMKNLSRSDVQKLVQNKNKNELIGRWNGDVSEVEKADIQNIFNIFNVNIYSAYSSLPIRIK